MGDTTRRVFHRRIGGTVYDRIAFCCMLLLPITTLFQSLPRLGLINQTVVLVMMTAALAALFRYRVAPTNIMVLLTSVFLTFYEFLITSADLYKPTTPMYLLSWVVMLFLAEGRSRALNGFVSENATLVRAALSVWSTLVLVSAFLPSSYVYVQEWGSGGYFASWTGDVFRLESSALAVSCLNVLYLRTTGDRRLAAVFSLMPVYCMLMGGSRTYFVLIAASLMVLLFYWCKTRRTALLFSLSMVAVLGLLAGISSIGGKFESQSTVIYGTDLAYRFTSGRSEFWSIDVDYFLSSGPLSQLLGMGYNRVYDVNGTLYGAYIYAHNDFINIAMTYGYIGLIVYLAPVFKFVRTAFCKGGFAVGSLCLFIWLFNAFFNMSYTYICSTMSLIFLFEALTFEVPASFRRKE